MGLRKFCVLGCIVASLSGCASYDVRVSSMALSKPVEKTYSLSPAPSVAKDELLFAEVRKYVDLALSLKGYVLSPNPAQRIELAYGYQQTSRTSPFMAWPTVVGGSSGTIGFGAGFSFHPVVQVSLLYRLTLDSRETATGRQLWKTEITADSDSDEIREVIPVMVYAAKDVLATQMSGHVDTTLFAFNSSIREFTKRAQMLP